jgi:hypothetical protein
VTRSVSAATILRRAAVASLPAGIAGRDDDLARDREGDGLGGGVLAEVGEELLDLLGGFDDLFGPGRSLLLELALGGGESGVQLVLLAVEAALELVLHLERARPPLPPLPSASSSSAASARLRASSSTWVTMYRAK